MKTGMSIAAVSGIMHRDQLGKKDFKTCFTRSRIELNAIDGSMGIDVPFELFLRDLRTYLDNSVSSNFHLLDAQVFAYLDRQKEKQKVRLRLDTGMSCLEIKVQNSSGKTLCAIHLLRRDVEDIVAEAKLAMIYLEKDLSRLGILPDETIKFLWKN